MTCSELVATGKAIREARLKKRIGLRDFVKRLHISPSYYSKVERGLALASVFTYEYICEELELDAPALLAPLGLVDSMTRRLFEDLYREDPASMKAALEKLSGKDESEDSE